MMIDPGQLQQPKSRGGMFGGGDWKSALAAALAGFAAGGGNPAGQMALQMLHQRLGQKREDQQYEQRRQAELQDYGKKLEMQAQYAKPHVNDTAADFEYIRQQLGDDAAKRFLQTKTNPVVMTPYGPMPYSAVMGGQQGGGLPPVLSDKDFETQGGPSPLGVRAPF